MSIRPRKKSTYHKERNGDSIQQLRGGGGYPIKLYPDGLSSVIYVLCLLDSRNVDQVYKHIDHWPVGKTKLRTNSMKTQITASGRWKISLSM